LAGEVLATELEPLRYPKVSHAEPRGDLDDSFMEQVLDVSERQVKLDVYDLDGANDVGSGKHT
jgi:hypothetical protein